MSGLKPENQAKKKFSLEKSQHLSDSIIELLNDTPGTIKEKVYAISHVLHTLGCAIYDKEDCSKPAVEKDYSESPTWPAALILISHLPHEILDLITQSIKTKETDETI